MHNSQRRPPVHKTLKEFISKPFVAIVTLTTYEHRKPDLSIKIGTLDGDNFVGPFLRYSRADFPFDKHLLNAINVLNQADAFVKAEYARLQQEEAVEEARRVKEAQEREKQQIEHKDRKDRKKTQYLANKEKRREENRTHQKGASGGGGKGKGGK